MAKVFITGDTHGEMGINRLSSKLFPQGNTLTKDDYVIVAGDFGLVWSPPGQDATERYWLKWLDKRRFTTLFIDGNHENHALLAALPTVDLLGGKAGKVNDSVYHLRRGETYAIGDKSFLAFGGALSPIWDRQYRVLGKTYWVEETATAKDLSNALVNVGKVGNKVDFIVAHTVPPDMMAVLGHHKNDEKDPTQEYLGYLVNKIAFGRMFCGHFHIDKEFGKYSLLYLRVLRVI